ncbi:outer membrane lipoprotein-sorting protein [bacterium]|nr:outer membrane lipoprotein-sorting protein [bacterium]
MRNQRIIPAVLILAGICIAQTPDGNALLKKIDENMIARNKIITSRMIIHGRRGSRTIESRSWIQGAEKSFTEYLAPAREKGTKMLKLEDQLWTYTPSADRSIRISGHMLRQSVMGSDLSYEDMMEDPKLENLYDAAVVGEDTCLGRSCWVMELQAKVVDVAYHSRKIWIDKTRYNVLKEERYAKSGKLLKTTVISETMQVEGRWFAKRAVFKDVLNQGKGTEFILESLELDADIPDYIFSKAALRK